MANIRSQAHTSMIYDQYFSFSSTVSVEGTYRFESIVGSIKLMSTDCDFWKISGDAGHVGYSLLVLHASEWGKMGERAHLLSFSLNH